ncbi:MAG: alpha/beta hydrolase [Clostridia bacterium]|nr:alpha/beta hydrolase [Clostridia bacterium]
MEKVLPYIIIGAVALVFVTFTAAFICFMRIFYSPKRPPKAPDYYPLPRGDIYIPFHKDIIEGTKAARSMPRERIEIKSHDGLKLVGYYYEYKKGAPIEIMFHGYEGDGERDLAVGIERCFKIGRSALIVDQRAHGESEGSVVTFGIKERFDCISWANYVIDKFGKDVKIILTGISMGAATVMMASGEALPKNVVSVLADCGYTSPKEIIIKVINDMRLPSGLLYPFVKLGALVFGKFNLEETSPIEAMKKTALPVIFIHGDTDAFVPHDMSQRLYEACASENKKFVTVNGAGHGIAYPVNKELYLDSLRQFEAEAGFLK